MIKIKAGDLIYCAGTRQPVKFGQDGLSVRSRYNGSYLEELQKDYPTWVIYQPPLVPEGKKLDGVRVLATPGEFTYLTEGVVDMTPEETETKAASAAAAYQSRQEQNRKNAYSEGLLIDPLDPIKGRRKSSDHILLDLKELEVTGGSPDWSEWINEKALVRAAFPYEE